MNKRIGIIGVGNMGEAIIKGLISAQISPQTIIAFNPTPKPILNDAQVVIAPNAKKVAEYADLILLAVKPQKISDVLLEILGSLTDDKIILSVAAGVTLESMELIIGKHRKIIRLMPNTPVLVNEAMISITPNKNISTEELTAVQTLFNHLGRASVVDESIIHAVVGVSGSSPAYTFMFIEALADGAVLAGMPRKQAYEFAAQAVLGAAKLVLDLGEHPAVLKDAVCSPAGTTIEGVKSLENDGLRSAVINAVKSCVDKSIKMSQKEK